MNSNEVLEYAREKFAKSDIISARINDLNERLVGYDTNVDDVISTIDTREKLTKGILDFEKEIRDLTICFKLMFYIFVIYKIIILYLKIC